jgi:hypothetical protein
MKKIILPILVLFALASCDKPELHEQLGDNGQQILKIAEFGGIEDPGFGAANLVLDPSDPVIEARVELDAAHVLDNDITVTIGADPTAIEKYNATQSNPDDQYQLLPEAAYSFSTTTVVIPAGSIYSEPFTITFNPDEIDPALNLMIPVAIKSISGAPSNIVAAPSTSVAYFHLIGNPLAGTYTSTGWVYHPSVPRAVDEVKTLAPLSATKLLCDFGDLGASGYVAVFETGADNHVTISAAPGAAGAPYTQFDDGLPPDNPGYTPAWPGSAQCNNTYDPATKTFKVRYGYLGATGWRVTEEILVHQ